MIPVSVWMLLAIICLVLAAIALISAIVVEGSIEATTWFTVADLAVCSAAIYIGVSGKQFSSLLPNLGLVIAVSMAAAHITYTWIKAIFRLITGHEPPKDVGEKPDAIRAFLTRVLEKFGYRGRVDPGDHEVAERVVEVCRRWGWEG
ncbi:hypothetical protein [Methanopyrus sp.]